MKQGHFTLMYIVCFLFCFVSLWMEKYQYDLVVQEKQRIERGLMMAMEETAWALTSVIYESEQTKLQVVEESFFENLYLSLGLLGDLEEQDKLRMYIPMLILAEEDGAYFYYLQEVEEEELIVLKSEWSEKLYYEISEESTMEKKKSIIAEAIEKEASAIISTHNYIAEQYGYSYSFYVPQFLQNTAESLEFPMVFAVFQGWPLTASGDVVYENCLDTGAYLQKVEKYIVEVPSDLSYTVAHFHQESCEYIGKYGKRVLEGLFTKEQAMRNYGAIPCENCMEYTLIIE